MAVAVDPEMVAPPGLAVTVHGVTGKPLKSTLPVAKAQVGCVIEPMVGAVGNGFTINATALEVANGEQVPLTTQRYW